MCIPHQRERGGTRYINPAFPESQVSDVPSSAPDTLRIFAPYFIPKKIVLLQKKLRGRLSSHPLANAIGRINQVNLKMASAPFRRMCCFLKPNTSHCVVESNVAASFSEPGALSQVSKQRSPFSYIVPIHESVILQWALRKVSYVGNH
jgi:hypothetical protein